MNCFVSYTYKNVHAQTHILNGKERDGNDGIVFERAQTVNLLYRHTYRHTLMKCLTLARPLSITTTIDCITCNPFSDFILHFAINFVDAMFPRSPSAFLSRPSLSLVLSLSLKQLQNDQTIPFHSRGGVKKKQALEREREKTTYRRNKTNK